MEGSLFWSRVVNSRGLLVQNSQRERVAFPLWPQRTTSDEGKTRVLIHEAWQYGEGNGDPAVAFEAEIDLHHHGRKYKL